MRLLFARDIKSTPDMVGGVERNTDALIGRLRKRGVTCAGLAQLSRDSWTGLLHRAARRLSPLAKAIPDHRAGYPHYRYWNPVSEIGTVIAAFRPDVAVVQTGSCPEMVEAFAAHGVPVVNYLHGFDFLPPMRPPQQHELISFLACGQAVAATLARTWSVQAPVVRPIIEPGDYRTATTRREVLFINPRIEKGVDVAWALAAARPDIPFRFMEAWEVSRAAHDGLVARARELGNVTVEKTRGNMRSRYARARVLLAPSHSEGHSRAMSEAQVSGIPVLSSDRRGTPEAVGPGGIVLPLGTDMSPWIEQLSRIYDDEPFYQSLVTAAFAHAARPDFAPNVIVDQFMAHVTSRVNVPNPVQTVARPFFMPRSTAISISRPFMCATTGASS
eukprot:gene2638-2678_t